MTEYRLERIAQGRWLLWSGPPPRPSRLVCKLWSDGTRVHAEGNKLSTDLWKEVERLLKLEEADHG